MNGLFGYSMSGVGVLGQMAQAGGTNPTAVDILVDLMDGKLGKELTAQRRKQQNQTVKLQNMRAKIDRIPAGAAKQKALTIWGRAKSESMKANASVQEAIGTYNEMNRDIQTYTFGKVKPPQLGDLGAIPLVPVAVGLLAAGVVASAGVLALAQLVGAIRGQQNATKGYIDQIAGVFREIGGAIKEIPGVITSTTWLVALGVAGFFGYQIYKDYGTGRRGAAKPTAPRKALPSNLKLIEGEVI